MQFSIFTTHFPSNNKYPLEHFTHFPSSAVSQSAQLVSLHAISQTGAEERAFPLPQEALELVFVH